MAAHSRLAPVLADDDAWLATELLEVVRVIRAATRRAAGRDASGPQLTGAQLDVVRLLDARPAICVTETADALGLMPNTVSTLVGQLVASGLVSRTTDPADRRVARLELTARARRRVDGWRARRAAAVGDALAALSAQDRQRLAGALPALLRLAVGIDEQATP
jgi:DNA-binding MarR family transcriptional regulator